MNPHEIGKEDWKIMNGIKSIGRMIAELEQDLEACRKADQIIDNWKFIYSLADEGRKRFLLKEMFRQIGFLEKDIEKMLTLL